MVESKVTPKFTASNDGVIIFPENDIHRSVNTLQFSLLDDMSTPNRPTNACDFQSVILVLSCWNI